MIDYSTLNQVNRAIYGANQSLSLIDQGTALSVNSIINAGEYQAQGNLIQAQGYKDAIGFNQGIYSFNAAIDAENTLRNINALSRQFQLTTSKQISQQAVTGADLGSKSALMVRQETMGVFQEKLAQTAMDAENSRRAKLFESQVQQYGLSQQANAANYNASTARLNAANRAAEVAFGASVQKTKIIDQVNQTLPTLLSNINLGY